MLRRHQIVASALAPLFGVLVLPTLRSGLPASAWAILGLLLISAGVYFLGRGG